MSGTTHEFPGLIDVKLVGPSEALQNDFTRADKEPTMTQTPIKASNTEPDAEFIVELRRGNKLVRAVVFSAIAAWAVILALIAFSG
jgi:hypothetical protein